MAMAQGGEGLHSAYGGLTPEHVKKGSVNIYFIRRTEEEQLRETPYYI
jgi:hypothetical protein